jgi:hypothetical protein
MNRLLTRFLVIGVIAGISWVGYQISDITDCSGPRSDAWANATISRLEAANHDYDSWNDYTTLAQFSALATRAEQRYKAQLSENTLSCIEDLQGQTVDFFYYEWKVYEAASEGDFYLAAEYDMDSIVAQEAMWREYEKMAAKYGWDED